MAKAPAAEPAKPEDVAVECGIIMPIADMTGYSAGHWEAMLELISRGVRKAGMTPQPVWANGPADVLQDRIVRNLYEQPFAVCDVSGLNPNVMLELGIRLAFGKPTIIVNDGVVRAPFDIGPAEYVNYEKSLHYKAAEDFIERLSSRINAVRAVVDLGTYRPYIKTFGMIELGSPGTESVPIAKAVLDQLASVAAEVRSIKSRLLLDNRDIVNDGQTSLFNVPKPEAIFSSKVSPEAAAIIASKVADVFPDAAIVHRKNGYFDVFMPMISQAERRAVQFAIRDLVARTEAENMID